MLSIMKRLLVLLIVASPAYGAGSLLPSSQLSALTQKAEKGNLQAQTELAERYYKGDGVAANPGLAAHWYGKLAEKGVANAQMTLALMYIKGNGVTKDNAKAVHWLTQAAEQRISMAQYLLGVANAEGHGVPRDPVKAYMWFEIAAAIESQDAIAARDDLAKKMSAKEISQAEKMATDWWMRYHD